MISNNLLRVISGAGINQIRGINRAGAAGSGIPKHVSHVSASIANASTGITSTITVTFQRDPSDTNFSGVTVWAKGYQGNQTPSQIAFSTDSPVNFILNNTGEAVSLVIQANGNGGSAPLGTAPTTGLTLPKSIAGGVGTTTITTTPAVNIGLSAPAEFSVSGTPISTSTGGTFTVGKANQSAGAIWAGPASGAAAAPTFRNLTAFDIPVLIVGGYVMLTNTGTMQNFGGPGLSESANGGVSNVSGIGQGVEYNMRKYASTATAGTGAVFGENLGLLAGTTAVPIQRLRRYIVRQQLGSTTNIRAWFCMIAGEASSPGFALGTNPNNNIVGFRYVAGTDTSWVAYSSTSSANFTAVSTGVAPSTSVAQELRVDFDYANSALYFYIDGVLKATITTHIPNCLLALGGSIDNQSNAVIVTAQWSYMLRHSI